MRFSATAAGMIAIASTTMGIATPAIAAVIGQMQPAAPVTEARIAALAPQERGVWQAYLTRSRAQMAADKAALAAERAANGDAAVPAPPPHSKSGDDGMALNRPAAWYATPEARHVAATIVSFQTPAGGWGKNVDRTGPERLRGQHYIADDIFPAVPNNGAPPARKESWSYVGTIDNNATLTELRFLARAQAQAPGVEGGAWRASFLKGARYLLDAQYPNGGYPQVYPLEGGYHDAVTFNDNAMGSVVELLGEIAARQGDYAFVPADLAGEARAAWGKALNVILATQQVAGGVRTAWCQQHDALTLAPVGARNFEPASLTSGESANLLVLLMRQRDPSPQVAGAVHAGAAWLQRTALRDVEWGKSADGEGGRKLSAKPGAGPLWSRYYDLATMRPIFGDRDRSIHDDVNELTLERRNGYAWFGTGPVKALELYADWSRKGGAR